MGEDQMERVAELAGVDVETVRKYIEADWPNYDEHQEWIAISSDEEIASWLKACLP